MATGNFRLVTLATALAFALAMPLGENAAAQDNTAQPGAAATQTQVPQPQQGGVNWPGAGYGAGALLANVVYIPAKLVYALVGGVVGGGTYAVTGGNQQAADTVWRSALGGDYVVTPGMLQGQEPINFSGPTATEPQNTAPAQPSSNSSSSSSSGSSASMTTASSGNIAPITPLPAAGTSSSASSAPSTTTSSSGAVHPLDHGSGPDSSTAAKNIE